MRVSNISATLDIIQQNCLLSSFIKILAFYQMVNSRQKDAKENILYLN